MPIITIELKVEAPIERVFDLSRSIELHQISTSDSNETAIGGRLSGLIELNETVKWRAKHFGIYQSLTSKITEFHRPYLFIDEQIQGIFKSFKHQHKFSTMDNHTIMLDTFHYVSPFGVLGRIADYLFLKKYMTKLLLHRNLVIKQFAESDKWRAILQ